MATPAKYHSLLVESNNCQNILCCASFQFFSTWHVIAVWTRICLPGESGGVWVFCDCSGRSETKVGQTG